MTTNLEKRYFGLTKYEIFLALVAFFGWTLVAMDLNIFSDTLPEILNAYHLPSSDAGLITTAVFIGMFILQLIMSPLIEILGRKLMFNITLLGTAIFTGLTVFATTLGSLIGVRIIADGFSYSEFPAGLTIIQEGIPAKERGSTYGFVQSGFPVGYFLATLATLFIVSIGFRYVYLVGIVPAIVVIVARLKVKEPDRYKEYKKMEELKKENKSKELEKEVESTSYKVNTHEIGKFQYKQLFDPDLRKQNTVYTFAEFFHEFSTPTFLFFTAVVLEVYKHLPVSESLIILLFGTGIAAPAYYLAGLIGNHIKHGRKWAAAGSTILGGILSIFFIISTGFIPLLLTYVLFEPILLSWNGTIWSYYSETNPTRVRGTAGGFMNTISTLAWIVSSLLWTIALLTVGLTVWWIVGGSIVAVISGLIILIGGKTINPHAELEEISI